MNNLDTYSVVIPAKAGIQESPQWRPCNSKYSHLDPRVRGDDGK
jgi:hypothetical protein